MIMLSVLSTVIETGTRIPSRLTGAEEDEKRSLVAISLLVSSADHLKAKMCFRLLLGSLFLPGEGGSGMTVSPR